MSALILALALLAQTSQPPRAYTTFMRGDVVLATQDGRYPIELGAGCDGFNVRQNVDVYAGSGGVATLARAGTDPTCNVFIDALVSAVPCETNDAGDCDIDREGGL